MSDSAPTRRAVSLQIGAAARATGISTHTLRIWERRYGVVRPARTPGGSRVYSQADIDKLSVLKRLVDDHHSIGQIAHLDIAELRALAEIGRSDEKKTIGPALTRLDAASATRDKFFAALDGLDIVAAERLLLYAAGFLEPRALLLDIVAPIADEIGQRWQAGRLRIAHEHAASALLRNLLGTLMRTRPPELGAATAVATTLSGEHHELGALMAALIAVVNGWKVLYLGPNLPASEILHVVEQSDAAVVLLSVVDGRNLEAARELGALSAKLPTGVALVLGGRGAGAYADMVGARATVSDDLPALEHILRRARQ